MEGNIFTNKPKHVSRCDFKRNELCNKFCLRQHIRAGSWTVFYIENELFINLSLLSGPAVEQTLNKSWKATSLDANSLKLTDGTDEIVLYQYCEIPRDDCFDFNFKSCEDSITPRFANVFLENYDFCIP